MKKIFLISFLILISIQTLVAQRALYQPENMDFERGDAGYMPPGWSLTRETAQIGFRGFISSGNPASGNFALQLRDEDPASIRLPQDELLERRGFIFQSIDALSYRNKTIKIRAAVRTDFEDNLSSGFIFLEVRSQKDEVDTILFSSDTPARHKEWEYYELEANISATANMIRYGIIINGTGSVWLDDVSLEFVSPKGSENVSAMPLRPEQMSNINILAELYGYVRYYNPSAEAINADWEQILLKAIDYSFNVRDRNSFADSLQSLFKIVAPNVLITGNKEQYNNYSYKQPRVLYQPYTFYHYGGYSQRATPNVFSELRNILESMRFREAVAIKMTNIPKVNRGKYIRYSANAKTQPITAGSGAQLQLRADKEGGEVLFALVNDEKLRRNEDWEEYIIVAEYLDAVAVRMGLVFYGEGTAYFDDVKLEILDDNMQVLQVIDESDFENMPVNYPPRGWHIPKSVTDARYDIQISDELSLSGKQTVEIQSDLESFIKLPEPGEIFAKEMQNIYFKIPISVYHKDNPLETLPVIDFDFFTDGKPKRYVFNTDDLYSRIGILIEFYNILKHFSIKDYQPENSLTPINHLKNIFNRSLMKTAESSVGFDELLNSILLSLEDTQARLWQSYPETKKVLPALLTIIDEQLVVTKTDMFYNELQAGDIINEINSQKAMNYIKGLAQKHYANNENYKLARAITEFKSSIPETGVKLKITRGTNTLELTAYPQLLEYELVESRPDVIEEIEEGILYIDMTGMSDETFKDYLPEITNISGIIFDLRGFANMSVHTLGLFINEQIDGVDFEIPIYNYPDKTNLQTSLAQGIIKAHSKLSHVKPVFLIDERTIGYAESIVATAKFNNLGKILGKPTAGEAGEVHFYRLPGDYHLSFTAIKAYDNEGNRLSYPIAPDIIIEPTINDILQGKDLLLEKAIEHAKSQNQGK